METKKKRFGKKRYALAAAIFVAATALCWVFSRFDLPDTNILVVYLVAVLLIVRLTNSYLIGLLTAAGATFVFNFFFAEPLYNFSVRDPNYSVTFLSLVAIVVATGTVTTRATLAAEAAEKNEEEARAMYDLTSRLTDAGNLEEIAAAALRGLSSRFECEATCVLFDLDGQPGETALVCGWPKEEVRAASLTEAERQVFRERIAAGESAEAFDAEDKRCRIIWGSDTAIGAVCVPQGSITERVEEEDELLESMLGSVAIAMNRSYAEEQRLRDREEVTMERYRANLLRSISHDIRTPLSGIVGLAEMLVSMEEQDGDEMRRDLAQGIKTDAERLRGMVDNILSLTRLQDGRIALKKEPEAAEEVVDGAVSLMARRAPDREFTVDVPGELVLVPMDARLIEQVLLNLLDNAVRHTPPEEEIAIRVEADRENRQAAFTVSDRGSGIAEEDLPHIFQAFFTDAPGDSETTQNMGLGLAFCETAVKAHGGTIAARNREDGPGAEFTFTLPMEE